MIDTYRPINYLITSETNLELINKLTHELTLKYSYAFDDNSSLSRKLVSFQANKNKPNYRWYKFKEAFSSEMVNLFLAKYEISGNVFDPFAGSGTTLFSSSEKGINADGIELLPLAQKIIDARLTALFKIHAEDLENIQKWIAKKEWETKNNANKIPSIRISENAYPETTQAQIEAFLELISPFPNNQKDILFFALLCVLEEISYTRKDGQYLRWDKRAKRKSGNNSFLKTNILEFTPAITQKVNQIIEDISLNKNNFGNNTGLIRLFKGSNLKILPTIVGNAYDGIITSPPYCNRYDYTRTYALELALLGLNDTDVIDLRQQMLSSTVENKQKKLLEINPDWATTISFVQNNELLQTILSYLNALNNIGELNNSGIPRMINGYFEEMSCIFYECFRVLKPGKAMIVVNDNVRYEGISIPVDLILSDIASQIGFIVEKIYILQDKKGNSSQQMGKHGKENLRKCVYIWRKPL